MGQHITLALAPWEEAKPKPSKKKRYGSGNFERGTPWIERYWRRGYITDRQYEAATVLMKANRPVPCRYASTPMRHHVDGGTALGIEEVIDQQARLRELCRAIPEQYYAYVKWVVLEDKALGGFPGCSGGANFTRYMGRLGGGLHALSLSLVRVANQQQLRK